MVSLVVVEVHRIVRVRIYCIVVSCSFWLSWIALCHVVLYSAFQYSVVYRFSVVCCTVVKSAVTVLCCIQYFKVSPPTLPPSQMTPFQLIFIKSNEVSNAA